MCPVRDSRLLRPVPRRIRRSDVRLNELTDFLGNKTLYGRNWGCNSDYKFLHFEVCYYQAIEYAIQHKLEWVEAGAQGTHKVQRGYLPNITYSAHWIANRSFQDAIRHFLENERLNVEKEIEYLNSHSPFRITD